MKLLLYGWVRDIAFYTLLMVVVLHVLPDRNQKKYLQFFMGVVLIILVITPFLSFFGLDKRLNETYTSRTYDQELAAFVREQERLTGEYEDYVEGQLLKLSEGLEEGGEEKEAEGEKPGKEAKGGISEIHIEIGYGKEN